MSDKPTLTGPAPGFIKKPDYRVTVTPYPKRVRVGLGGTTIAETSDALLMEETNHDPVLYFPRKDVRMDLLERTDHTSF